MLVPPEVQGRRAGVPRPPRAGKTDALPQSWNPCWARPVSTPEGPGIWESRTYRSPSSRAALNPRKPVETLGGNTPPPPTLG